jgi:EAL domain-containing protein (putative c-di-GMP-specific phosphodiesterase class I)
MVSAAEALVRWNHPEWGQLAPDRFIALAEDTDLIVPLGEWVLRSACTMITNMRNSGLPPVRISVNVSSRQIERQNFAEGVTRMLEETGADPALLEIELTESCLMKHSSANISEIFGLRELGISIAIDDFGTGYSSLSYIKTLPIDHIKIDRSFVFDVTTNPNDQAIVESIITMSHKLGIRNIAEGVETVDQMEYLKSLGCDEIQGFYFHRPLTVAAFEELMRGQSCSAGRDDYRGAVLVNDQQERLK